LMQSRIWAFLRLSRPAFLLGGVVGFALGAFVARYEDFRIDPGLYVTGQVAVTSIQLTTQYLNEYWDFESDRLNTSRTFFTGGSGVIAKGEVSRKAAWRAAQVCSVLFSIVTIFLAIQFRIGLPVFVVLVASYALGCMYSSPPLRIESTGFGELTASLVVAGLLPMFGFLLFAGQLDGLILLVVAPLVAFHYAMLIAFDIPDIPSDLAGGKKTLLVRIGRDRGAAMHDALILAGFVMAAAAAFDGLPGEVAWSFLFTAPLAAFQVFSVHRANTSKESSFQWLTASAAALFAIATIIMAVGFWALG